MVRRSVLFTPGDRREMLVGAAETDADALVFDLEDGVAPDRTSVAREMVVDVLAEPSFDPDAELFVRVNEVESGDGRARGGEGDRGDSTARGGDGDEHSAVADVAALEPVGDAIDGVVLPKAESGHEVRLLAGYLRRFGLSRRVLALVETASGVLAAEEIAAAGATDALVFGAEDLAADLGATRTEEGTEVTYARQRVVTAARAAGVDAIDTLWTAFEDPDGLREDAARAVDLGYDGKLAIHPDQVGPINEAFTPDAEVLEWARRVLAAASDADADDRGAFVVDGEMIDAPLVLRAERIVRRASAAGTVEEQ